MKSKLFATGGNGPRRDAPVPVPSDDTDCPKKPEPVPPVAPK